MSAQIENIILFDGVCNLCNGFVQFLIRRDPRGNFKFASLQSETGRQLLKDHGYQDFPLTSIVFINGGKAWEMSSAVLQILKTMGGPWSLLAVFGIIPKGIRDAVYRFIARRRYLWFGKQEACMVPTPQLRQRFLS